MSEKNPRIWGGTAATTAVQLSKVVYPSVLTDFVFFSDPDSSEINVQHSVHLWPRVHNTP